MENVTECNEGGNEEENVGLAGRKHPHSVYLWKGFYPPVTVVTHDIFTNIEIVDVSLGKDHGLFLAKDGTVYAKGSNGFGQLGLGSLDMKAVDEPVKVNGISDPVTQVACGNHHNAVITNQGQAFCWGDSHEGQCGTGSLELVTYPAPVVQDIQDGFCREHGLPKPLIHVLFESVACGGQHSLAVSTEGEAWAWGYGKPLGLDELLHAPVPRRIEGLKGKKVVSVCCGQKHSLALVMKGDRSKANRSSSLLRDAPAKPQGLVVDKHNPSRCSTCQKEIFTYTDVSDMIIIDSKHNCENESKPSQSDDSTLIDDVAVISFSSPNTSGSFNMASHNKDDSANSHHLSNCGNSIDDNVNKFSGTKTLLRGEQSEDKPMIEGDVEDSFNQQLSFRDSNRTDSMYEIEQNDNMVINDFKNRQSIDLDTTEDDVIDSLAGVPNTTLDGSILVVPPELDQMDNDDVREVFPISSSGDSDVIKSQSSSSLTMSDLDKNVGEGTSSDSQHGFSASDSDFVKCDTKIEDSSVSSVQVNDEHIAGTGKEELVDGGTNPLERSESVVSDEVIWKRQVVCEDKQEEDDLQEYLPYLTRTRSRSPSSVSVKSLPGINQSDAMKYLQRQFKDEELEVDEQDGGKRRGGKDRRIRSVHVQLPGHLPTSGAKAEGVLSGLGFNTNSSPSALMKSITTRAMSSLQSLSRFGSTAATVESTPSLELNCVSTPEPGAVPTNVEQEGKGSDDVGEDVFSSPESYSMISSEGSDSSISPPLKPHHTSQHASISMVKSGTFIEWRMEMSTVDGNMTNDSGDGNSSSLGSIRTIEMKRRNLSSTSSPRTMMPVHSKSKSSCSKDRSPPPFPLHKHIPSLTGPSLSPYRQVVTTTEVWAWGHNDNGQLGIGDTIDRTQPTWVKHLNDRNVKKLVVGDSHSLALTDNSQVFSWGSNSHGQLGISKSPHVPSRIKFSTGAAAVWDIAAGGQHSILLVDTVSFRPDVLYCGKHPSDKATASMKKTSEPTQIASLQENTEDWKIGVSAGGSSCGTLVWNLKPAVAEAVFELVALERILYSRLIRTNNLLLRPLKRSSFFSNLDSSPYKPALTSIITAFGILTCKVGKGVTDLTNTVQHKRNLKESRIVCERQQFIDAFRSYFNVFADFLSIGGFDYCTNAGREFFSEIQGNIQDLSGEKDKSLAASSLFLRAMWFPYLRLSAYSRIFDKMAEIAESPEDKNVFENTKLDWESLKSNLALERKTADVTKAFWDQTIPKISNSLRLPKRRLLKESKTHKLALQSARRFSSVLLVLFNDLFITSQNSILTSYPLETLWVEAQDNEGNSQYNTIVVTSPEERLVLAAPNASVKAEWLMSLQSTISKVLIDQKSLSNFHASGERFTPPLIRHATHVFVKQGIYKDATYRGTWLSGKVHGLGEMTWPDGSTFKGNFKRGLMHGYGTYTLVKGQGKEIQKGVWKDGKLNGLATILYASGDLYEGYLKEGQRFGHGMLQEGRIKSNCASVYIGEWNANQRHGYGVEDHILKGEKYMGEWYEDNRHGNGIMVTLDGMYFEGSFVNNKMTGFGVMISDDDTLYEGDFLGIEYLSGKGTLTLPQGDKLEGAFSGSLNEGLKINGTFHKASTMSKEVELGQHENHLTPKSRYFGRLCVPADSKWTDIFSHICATLGQGSRDSVGGSSGGGAGQQKTDAKKAWEVVAVQVSEGLNKLKEIEGSKAKLQRNHLQGLEMIPDHEVGPLDTDKVEEISLYLAKAFESNYHPLGMLMNTLVDVFRASYIGVGAHPRLLHHAVKEIRSYIRRLYRVLRLLFPVLPENGYCTYYPPSHIPMTTEEANKFVEGLEIEDNDVQVLTAAGLLYPILLPKVYPALFDLYALYNERSDDLYWERVTKLNRQGDVGLMAYLGIEQQFWLVDDILAKDPSKTLSTIKEECYVQAFDQLQQLSTAFSPLEKLKVIKDAFNEITQMVMTSMGSEVMWCMDDLFPIFQFVVVRAKIHHLGAEIHLIEDLMEPHMEHGEYGLMFTTLKACYFQIQNEKMPHH